MPHYADGTEARCGDVVKGKGYNLKDADGNLREFVGTVVGITPGSASCNVQVAHVVTGESTEEQLIAVGKLHQHYAQKCVIGCGPAGGKGGTPRVLATIGLEYGQCDQFEKIG
jgi:hypothetical protein